LTANDPLVAPAPVSTGSWPGSLGNDGGRESKIVPNSVSVVVGGAMLAPTTGLACPPGTVVRAGAGLARLATGCDEAGAAAPQATTRRARVIVTIGTRASAAGRRSVLTGSS
jgi:hypothetical protein